MSLKVSPLYTSSTHLNATICAPCEPVGNIFPCIEDQGLTELIRLCADEVRDIEDFVEDDEPAVLHNKERRGWERRNDYDCTVSSLFLVGLHTASSASLTLRVLCLEISALV